MILGRFNIQMVLVEDYSKLLFGLEIGKATDFSYALFSIGAGGVIIGWKK